MAHPDLNLLVVMDALLSELSVTRAARRLRLSPSAMSRALARLREATGDPLLVRAGRGLAPTPRALELRDQVGGLVQDARAALTPAAAPRLDRVERTFAVRCSEGFVENFGPALLRRIAADAAGARLWFVQKSDRTGTALREGLVDLETGVIARETAPELRSQLLFRDRLVGVVRAGHALGDGQVSLETYAAGRHIQVSRHGVEGGSVDEALALLGLAREIGTTVGGWATALALARETDLIATVPETHTGNLRNGMLSFALPLTTRPISVAMLWHPRQDADPVHRWLRDCVREVCGAA